MRVSLFVFNHSVNLKLDIEFAVFVSLNDSLQRSYVLTFLIKTFKDVRNVQQENKNPAHIWTVRALKSENQNYTFSDEKTRVPTYYPFC